MKRQLLLFAAMLCLGGTATAQNGETIIGDGNTVKEKREISEFTGINVKGPFEVTITDSGEDFVTLEGSQNIISLVEVEMEGETLSISFPNGYNFKSHKNNKVYIKVPYKTGLNSITLNGSGNIVCKNTIKTNMKVNLGGSGTISLSLDSAKSEACVLGSGDITLKGTVEEFSCKVVGSGSIDAENLESASVEAVVSGSGNANVICSKAIKGNISGSGNIAFSGNPARQDLKRSGSGEYKTF